MLKYGPIIPKYCFIIYLSRIMMSLAHKKNVYKIFINTNYILTKYFTES